MSSKLPLSHILPRWAAERRQTALFQQRTTLAELSAELAQLRALSDTSAAELLDHLAAECETLEAELSLVAAELAKSRSHLETQARSVLQNLLSQFSTLEAGLLRAEEAAAHARALTDLENLEAAMVLLNEHGWTGWKSSNPAMAEHEFEVAMAPDGWLAHKLCRLGADWHDAENHQGDAEERGETHARMEKHQQELEAALTKITQSLAMHHAFAPGGEVWAGYDALPPMEALALVETAMLPLAVDAVLEASQWRWPFRPNLDCLHAVSS